jgi:hypothetical protein
MPRTLEDLTDVICDYIINITAIDIAVSYMYSVYIKSYPYPWLTIIIIFYWTYWVRSFSPYQINLSVKGCSGTHTDMHGMYSVYIKSYPYPWLAIIIIFYRTYWVRSFSPYQINLSVKGCSGTHTDMYGNVRRVLQLGCSGTCKQ